jgi:hypothetical protein
MYVSNRMQLAGADCCVSFGGHVSFQCANPVCKRHVTTEAIKCVVLLWKKPLHTCLLTW